MVAPRSFTFCGVLRWGIDAATKISSAMDDYKAVLLDLLPGSLFCSGCELGNWDVCVRDKLQVVVASFIFLLAPESMPLALVVSVWMNHFAPPETGATNAIGARDRTVNLFRLGNREQEPFPGFLEGSWLTEHNDAIGSARRRGSRGNPVVLDRDRLF